MVSKELYEQWFSYLEEQYANGSIYVWGAQGQGYPRVNESWIRSKEKGKHRENALKTYKKSVTAGKSKKLRAFDCSGLGMYFLQNLHKIYRSDKTAHGMKADCKSISKSQLKKGDFVFRTYKSGSKKGRAYHIGYVCDNELNVIEAKGRAYGVVKKKFNSRYWNYCARPNLFKKYIEEGSADIPFEDFDRPLKKGDRGEDVKELQALLNLWGTEPALDTDGVFGAMTQAALKAFQKTAESEVDGQASEATLSMLQRYRDDNHDGETKAKFTRLLKKGVRGDDVALLQGRLNEKGANIRVDGIFGGKTKSAVQQFQSGSGLEADGVVGANTAKALGARFKQS